MASVITNPRSRWPILWRQTRYRATEIPHRLGRDLPVGVRSIGVIAEDRAVVGDALARLGWSAPPDLRLLFARTPTTSGPMWAGDDIPDVSSRVDVGDPGSADLQVLARAGGTRWMRRLFDRRVMIGDPGWYSGVEVEGYVTISSIGTTDSQWAAIRARSADLLSGLVEKHRGVRAAVFGTGPSMTTVDPGSLDCDLTIACNSVISNREWLKAARPAVIAFGDPVFHFGPSRYAAQFRSDLRRAAIETDALFVIPERYAPLVQRRLPEVAVRMIAVAHSRRASMHELAPNRLEVPETANVLTLLMLPVALAVAKEIEIAGCDGRRPSERYFWNHNPEVQYGDDLMKSAFDAHPSFFRDRDYEHYYDTHCDQLETLLTRAEADGFRFHSITPSEIPALRARSR